MGDYSPTEACLNCTPKNGHLGLKSPVYFVYGNHDVYVGLDEVFKNLKENNVTVLQNEVKVISSKDESILKPEHMRAL